MNNTIFLFLYDLTHRSHVFDWVIVFFAVYFPYVVLILAGLFLLFHHEVLQAESPFKVFLEKKREILLVFFTGAFAWVISHILKTLFHTLRPFEAFSFVHPLFTETGYGFPSGHATFFGALAGALFFTHRKAGFIFMFFALVIGLARIIGGVHFPFDIIGGYIVGALVGFSVELMKPYIEKMFGVE